jgi:hypothetical protein
MIQRWPLVIRLCLGENLEMFELLIDPFHQGEDGLLYAIISGTGSAWMLEYVGFSLS